MAEAPPRGGAPPGTAQDADQAPPQTGEKRRTTVMGLPPAPHLGLSGSAGAKARAEAEARKQRVQARLSSRPPPPVRELKPSVEEEIIEPLPPPFAVRSAPPRQPPSPTEMFEGGTPTTIGASPFEHATPTTYEPYDLPPPAARWSEPPPAIVVGQPLPMDGVAGNPSNAILALAEVDTTTIQRPPQHPPVKRSRPVEEAPAAEWEPVRSGPTTERMPVVVPTPTNSLVPSQTRTGSIAPNTHAGSSVVPSTPPGRMASALVIRPYEPPTPPPDMGLRDKRLVLLHEPESPRAASFRLLRDNLIAKNLPRVIAVSSAARSDGKTTCVINLALALTEQRDTRVLLMDGNFFEPDLAQIFGLERLAPLTGTDDPMVVPYKIAAVTRSLHVAGILKSDLRHHRFEQHKFDVLLERLCTAEYDYIIIDTPALDGSAAVARMVGGADASLIAVRSGGGTTARQLRRAVSMLPSSKTLGVVLVDGVT
jgi:Mrp family chromosome partitioning ATPase